MDLCRHYITFIRKLTRELVSRVSFNIDFNNNN